MIHRIADVHLACREGNIDLLKDSVTGIDSYTINQSNELGLSAIHVAVLYNDSSTAQALINVLVNNGANVNVVDKRSGDSLLHLCLSFKPPEVSLRLIPYLLKKGCNYNIKNDIGKSALDVARDNGFVDLESLIREYPQMKHVTDNYNSNTYPRSDSYPMENEPVPIKPLKESLIESIVLSNIQQIKKLLEEGADANDDEDTKYFPIHYAVSKGQGDPVTILQLLENHKAHMESKTEENDTVLTLAIKKIEHEELCLKVIEYLKGCGISTTDKDNDGNDAKTLAMLRHFDSVVVALGSVHDFEGPYHPIHNICRNQNLNLSKKLTSLENPYFKNDVPVDLRTKPENETCLHIACRNRDAQLVRYLLAKDAKVRVFNKNGETPLSITTDITKDAVIKQMLIEADNRQNVKEETIAQVEPVKVEAKVNRCVII